MKVSGFWALFLAVGTALMLFTILSPIVSSKFPAFPDFVATTTRFHDKTTLIAVNRKLKENGSGIGSNNKVDTGYMTLDDYHPIHPPPGSRDVPLHPHPIEHGSPLNPYIPKPPPPPASSAPAPAPSNPE